MATMNPVEYTDSEMERPPHSTQIGDVCQYVNALPLKAEP